MATLSSSRANTEHPGYLNSILQLGLFTTLCNDAGVLARFQAVATASHILRFFLHLPAVRLKHVPIYWTGDREKLGQEKDRSMLAPLWQNQRWSFELCWWHRQSRCLLQFWTETGDTCPREKEIVMGLVYLGIQDFSKQFWEQIVVKNRDRQEWRNANNAFPAPSPSATNIICLELMWLSMALTGRVTVILSVQIVHQKTG